MQQQVEKEKGIVKFYNAQKGFGFITVERTEKDIFVYAPDLIDEIQEEDRVLFFIERGPKGAYAIDVQKETPFL